MVSYVIRAEELKLLEQLPPGFPQPVAVEWINRSTDQKLRRSSVEMLLRTLSRSDQPSESVKRLHRSAGLRLQFQSEEDRNRFAALFRSVRAQLTS